MRKFTAETADPDVIAQELLHGKGAVLLTGLFTQAQIADARQIIHDYSADADKVTHFQGQAEEDGKLNLQRRVWNLLAKGDVFSDMAAHPVIMKVLRKFLGTEFIMGSIAANRILPGGPGQEPHVDYPYWDMYKAETHPIGLNASFPMNAQVSILLDPFTEETGATAYVPGTQKELRYPTDADDFYGKCERMLGEPGDVALFFGAAWHCAMPNTSDIDRSAVLINYAPKWLTPIEEMHAALPDGFLDAASDDLRQLLGLKYPHPQSFDEAEARNTIGRK
ncbi:phytanoyl-CoA dioxygenase family protein [Yoonia sp.]|uniref:phytanoyl-CoA dioxygenase family protein n=1 Tax=Yoonia sp. TaxID=2212373 RepID=UPI00358EAE65